MSELQVFADRIATVARPEDLFGALVGTQDEQLDALERMVKRFARVAHEDLYGRPAEKQVAHDAFVRLMALAAEGRTRIASGHYGKATLTQPAHIKTKSATYAVGAPIAGGDLANVYRASADGKDYVLKLSRHSRFNDLLDAERRALTVLHAGAADTTSLGAYFPHLVESAVVRVGADARRLNVAAYKPGFRVLTEVAAEYPNGIDPRHFVWMFNRLLTVIGYARMCSMTHCAILPPHVLIHPETHGLLLVDWAYSVPSGHRIAAISEAHRAWYPPEVLARQPATPATDVYMAGRCMSWILGGDGDAIPSVVPPKLRRILEACLIRNPYRRPQDPWLLYDQFVDAAKDVYGPRRFVPLEMEVKAGA
jgi:hypothetical protein